MLSTSMGTSVAPEKNCVNRQINKFLRAQKLTEQEEYCPAMHDIVEQSAETMLHGSVLILLQFDACEAIRLDQRRNLIRVRNVKPSYRPIPQPSFF
ncbi:MAG: hypothetical protein ABI383_15640 [Acidobacteriaceae bacterium]